MGGGEPRFLGWTLPWLCDNKLSSHGALQPSCWKQQERPDASQPCMHMHESSKIIQNSDSKLLTKWRDVLRLQRNSMQTQMNPSLKIWTFCSSSKLVHKHIQEGWKLTLGFWKQNQTKQHYINITNRIEAPMKPETCESAVTKFTSWLEPDPCTPELCIIADTELTAFSFNTSWCVLPSSRILLSRSASYMVSWYKIILYLNHLTALFTRQWARTSTILPRIRSRAFFAIMAILEFFKTNLTMSAEVCNFCLRR